MTQENEEITSPTDSIISQEQQQQYQSSQWNDDDDYYRPSVNIRWNEENDIEAFLADDYGDDENETQESDSRLSDEEKLQILQTYKQQAEQPIGTSSYTLFDRHRDAAVITEDCFNDLVNFVVEQTTIADMKQQQNLDKEND